MVLRLHYFRIHPTQQNMARTQQIDLDIEQGHCDPYFDTEKNGSVNEDEINELDKADDEEDERQDELLQRKFAENQADKKCLVFPELWEEVLFLF